MSYLMVKRILFEFIEGLIRNIAGPIGQKIRFYYYKKRLGSCGKNVRIDVGVVFQSPKDIFLGSNIWIDKYVLLLAGKPNSKRKSKTKKNTNFSFNIGEIHILDKVHIAPFVVLQGHGGISILGKSTIASGTKIYSMSHHYKNLNNKNDLSTYYFSPHSDYNEQFMIIGPVVIDYGSAVGLNSIILPGTTIPAKTWFGTNMTIQGTDYKTESVYYNNQDINHKQK